MIVVGLGCTVSKHTGLVVIPGGAGGTGSRTLVPFSDRRRRGDRTTGPGRRRASDGVGRPERGRQHHGEGRRGLCVGYVGRYITNNIR